MSEGDVHPDNISTVEYVQVMSELLKCTCFNSAVKAYIKWFMFRFSETNEDILNRILIEDQQVFQLITEIKALLGGNWHIETTDSDSLNVTLDIQSTHCDFQIGDRKVIKIGVINGAVVDKLNIYKDDSFPLNLFVFVINNSSSDDQLPKCHIYDFDTLELHHDLVKPENLEMEDDFDKLYTSKRKKSCEIGDIKKSGGNIYHELIPEKLRNKLVKRSSKQWVWIYCDSEQYNPIWEWLYTGQNSEGFFWGDKYSIIRLPKKCEFIYDKLKGYKDSKKIFNFAYLRGKAVQPNHTSSISKFLSPIRCNFIKLERIPENLHGFDGIHVFTKKADERSKFDYVRSIGTAINKNEFFFHKIVENGQTKNRFLEHLKTIIPELSTETESLIFEEDNEQIKITSGENDIASLVIREKCCYYNNQSEPDVKIGKVLDEGNDIKLALMSAPSFLFLNICGCDSIKSEIMMLVSPETWIDVCFDIPKKFALDFEKCASDFEKKFYEMFSDNKTNVAEALIKARSNMPNNLWRFAYILNGNPYVTIT
jgi:hypothetical protein